MKQLVCLLLLNLTFVIRAAELRPPLQPDEAAVIRGIVSVENYNTATVVDMPRWLSDGIKRDLAAVGVGTGSLKGWMIEVRRDPRPYRGGFFSCLYNADGRVVALNGNGPWLRNDSLRALKAMPELRSIHWDHNGFLRGHPEYGLYDGTGFDALANSKLSDIKIGLSFNDKGMEQCAKIKGLRGFNTTHSGASDSGVAFFKGHPNLESFGISQLGMDNVTQRSIELMATMPKLTRIAFGEGFATYKGGFEHLAKFKGRLTSIDLTMSIVLPSVWTSSRPIIRRPRSKPARSPTSRSTGPGSWPAAWRLGSVPKRCRCSRTPRR
ncbi:MAG: hypothetical protein ACKODH_16250 [Limisphaerales bacterium]